ncbi:polyamine ABC transporter ATP-binding protein [Desulfofundulus thermobenzoicus]|uniref:Spermidine/putrescine import ATP-binding protein PotA n=1 Tax=Desulfofundulus thermobenzoicus TaxID=29376 RepID=A0A6N7IL83_9FIRM|nr:ABC transporter ATP-binding protein [Desulfofundulus thermobenzoicus]MQL50736.1 polyamine ABC transporter ATP-binding protein [Desulfofundulus thermobenzoicus]
MSEYMVQLVNVTKSFGEGLAVDNVSLDIRPGEFLTLLGPSGCGKTTTLRMIAGFEQPTGGDILLDGESVLGKPPYARNVNTVFQSYALFPHMTVFENIAFGLKMKGQKKETIVPRVNKAIELVDLSGKERAYPQELSGGQQQRVALARALVMEPRVLLLDEPLSALDLKLRKQMQLELKHLQRQLGITFVYVTHDQEEALTMSDRIAVMNAGVIEQIGTPREIYERPVSVFVATFIGDSNILEGTITGRTVSGTGIVVEDCPVFLSSLNGMVPGQKVYLSVRPEHMFLTASGCEGNGPCLPGRLLERIFAGSSVKSVVALNSGKQVTVSESGFPACCEIGDAVAVGWHPGKEVILSDAQSSDVPSPSSNAGYAGAGQCMDVGAGCRTADAGAYR